VEQFCRGGPVRRSQTGEQVQGPQNGGGPYLVGHSTTERHRGATGAQAAPEAASSPNAATPKKKAAKPPKGAKKAEATKAASPKPAATTPREASKTTTVLELIRRPKGATLKEIMEATGWQAHSVRGFISGTVGKKLGLTVESSKRDDGERVYKLTK
jgi:Protein of unknown function (DUF3489)